MQILSHKQVKRKIKRLALEILESNFDTKHLYLGGINNNGQRFAHMLLDELEQQSSLQVTNFQVSLTPANPVSTAVGFDIDIDELVGAHVLIADDVANTGRTLFYACKPLMEILPASLAMAVLVDRKHKSFPVQVDFVGLSLATTLMDNIKVNLQDQSNLAAHLV